MRCGLAFDVLKSASVSVNYELPVRLCELPAATKSSYSKSFNAFEAAYFIFESPASKVPRVVGSTVGIHNYELMLDVRFDGAKAEALRLR